MFRIICFFLFPIILFLSSCHKVNRHFVLPFPKDTDVFQSHEEAKQLLLSLKNINSELKTFKGIGSTKVWENKRYYSSRIAWIGAGKKKLRMEIFGKSGLPAESIAVDGKNFYFFSHFNKKFYKKKLGKQIEKILPVSISPDDIVSILSGRIPFCDYEYIFFKKDMLIGEDILILENSRHNVIEKIFVDASAKTVKKIEIYNKYGSVKYRAVFNNFCVFQNYKIPLNIEISSNEAGIKIIIDRCWTDVLVPSSTFVLTAP